MNPSKSLQGRIALVTGAGRNAGIGAAICCEVARQGSDVFFTYWHPYDLETYPEDRHNDPARLADKLKQMGIRVAHVEMDLSKSEAPANLFKAVEQALGAPSILINNACHDFEIPFAELTPEILDKHYAVNVRAVTLLCKEFVQRGKPGSIINLTSGQSLGSMGAQKIPYTITKAALEMLAKQLAPDLMEQSITIHSLDPGPTDTGWMTEELKAQLKQQSARGKIATPEDTARLVVSLLTSNNPPTGSVIHADR